MVNERGSVKFAFLSLLRSSRQPVSGETAAAEFGVSRVAVWKAAQSLQKSGYGIRTEANGYTLVADRKDSLFPWEMGELEHACRHWDITDSTMHKARQLAEKNAPDGTVVTADVQTDGHGTSDRTWVSREGNLYFTLITRPQIPLGMYASVRTAVQMALADAVRLQTGADCFPRWPNDMCVYGTGGDECKFAGILTETAATGDRVEWINIGIGVNTSRNPGLAGTTDLSSATGKTVLRKDILSAFLRFFPRRLSQPPGETAREWTALSAHTGHRKTLVLYGDRNERPAFFSGIFEGTDETGCALFRTESGLKRIFPGNGSVGPDHMRTSGNHRMS